MVSGHLSRLLDTTNEAEAEVLGSLLRVLLELEKVGIVGSVLRKGLSKAQQGAWIHTDFLHRALRWDAATKGDWSDGYDLRELERRRSDAAFSVAAAA